MKRSEKAAKIVDILEGLYPKTPVPLDHTDAFTLLVAVALSAQTTDLKVNEVTPALFALAPTPQKMMALDVEVVLKCIRQLGLAPTKAKNLVALSAKLVNEFGGKVPSNPLEQTASTNHFLRTRILPRQASRYERLSHMQFLRDQKAHRLRSQT